MSLHVAASGAKQGQWVTCSAQTPASCRNQQNGGKHIEPSELYKTQIFLEQGREGRVYLKDITAQNVTEYEELPAADKKVYDQMLADRQKDRREAMRNRPVKVKQQSAAIREIVDQVVAHNQKQNTARRTVRPKPPVQPELPATKELHYANEQGVPRSITVDTYSYPAEEKRVLEKFYDRATRALTYQGSLKYNEELIHYYVTHKDIIDKYHSSDFVQKTFKSLQKRSVGIDFFYLEAWNKYTDDVKMNVALGSHYKLEKARNESRSRNAKGKKKVTAKITELQDRVAEKVTDEGIHLPQMKVTETMGTNTPVETPASKIADFVGGFLYRLRKGK